MRTMGVKIRQWKGAWWVLINHQGARKAKRIGTGEPGKKAAKQVAQQIQARLALGQAGLPIDRAHVTLEDYAATWLEQIKQIRKPNTYVDYVKRLKQWILPSLGPLDLRDLTRDKVRALVTEQLSRSLSPKTVSNNVRVLSSLLRPWRMA